MTTLTDALNRLGVDADPLAVWIGGGGAAGSGDQLVGRSPIDGSTLAEFAAASVDDVPRVLHAATEAFKSWRVTPGPQRGEFVRRVGNRFRELKAELATVISWEAGKITQEALGEVQEVIDICDFAVGLSRQLHGLTIASERPSHRLAEQWHPLGPVGVITAFNFPMAVWAWNAALAWVCGDPVVWKPSEKTPLCALACQAVVASVLSEMPHVPPAVSCVLIGTGAGVGESLADAPELPLISATGSTAMGRAVAQRVAARLGRSLLELGGNNGMIVTPSADLELAVRAIVFSAVGTCGQRCTSLRRLIVHESLADELIRRIASVYERLPIGNPLDTGTLVGPLIDERAWTAMHSALIRAKADGAVVHGGERLRSGPGIAAVADTASVGSDAGSIRHEGTPIDASVLSNAAPVGGVYVRPALVEIDPAAGIVQEETFAPILYVMRYRSLDEAISLHNNVPQGLASSILTSDLREAELFCSPAGSDCGIVNVNVGPSGAEIGGAFGGEKATGGGRESGSDSWKNYMRRATNTINYSNDLPLAQGIKFEV